LGVPQNIVVIFLRPDWLAPGAAYLGRATADGFDCHVWTKADFITYYEDAATRRPVKWVFYTGNNPSINPHLLILVLKAADGIISW
jgi:hypothetical protein